MGSRIYPLFAVGTPGAVSHIIQTTFPQLRPKSLGRKRDFLCIARVGASSSFIGHIDEEHEEEGTLFLISYNICSKA